MVPADHKALYGSSMSLPGFRGWRYSASDRMEPDNDYFGSVAIIRVFTLRLMDVMVC